MEHKAWHHFLTITQHKLLVMQNCFRVGLFKQGLLHDLSKYSPAEFLTGVHYYQGDRSPKCGRAGRKRIFFRMAPPQGPEQASFRILD